MSTQLKNLGFVHQYLSLLLLLLLLSLLLLLVEHLFPFIIHMSCTPCHYKYNLFFKVQVSTFNFFKAFQFHSWHFESSSSVLICSFFLLACLLLSIHHCVTLMTPLLFFNSKPLSLLIILLQYGVMSFMMT